MAVKTARLTNLWQEGYRTINIPNVFAQKRSDTKLPRKLPSLPSRLSPAF